MLQLASVMISFLVIPVLIRKKVKLSYTLLITAGVLGILSGIGVKSFILSIVHAFTDYSSVSTILSVIMVSILGGLMKCYKILEMVVYSLAKIIKNKKVIIMLIPAMIGMLIVPGGALLSAPFVNDLGEEMHIPKPRRAAINLVFRHISMFILPYSTSLLIVSGSVPQVNIQKVILLNLIFVVSVILLGYFLYLRDVGAGEKDIRKKEIISSLKNLLIYTSPIYIPVLLNLFMEIPFYLGLIFSTFTVYLIGDKKDFLKNLKKSLNIDTAIVVIATFIIKGIILNMSSLLEIFSDLFLQSNSVITIMIVFLASSFLFGFITGNQGAALAIILSMLSGSPIMDSSLDTIIYFSYGCAFIGYFFSPLHLCQAFTLQHMGVRTEELYKEYRIYAPSLLIVLIVSFIVLI